MNVCGEDPSGMLPLPGRPIEERHLEAAMDYLAYLMGNDGEVYAPIYARLEMELETLQKRRGPIERARMRLAAQTIDCGQALIGGHGG